jgi:hypothetical protein
MFPETARIDFPVGSETVPRHPAEQVRMFHELYGKTFVTVSEHLILLFQKAVRDERIHPTELAIYCVERRDYDHKHPPGRRMRVCSEGDFIDDWPGGLFTERLELLR